VDSPPVENPARRRTFNLLKEAHDSHSSRDPFSSAVSRYHRQGLDRDVLVVDTGTSPAAARAFVEDLKALTSKPIRYVVNTHFHYDHTDGNQVYAGKADIIAHDYVKYAIQNLNVLHREPYQTSQLTNVPNRIDALKKQIAGARDAQAKTALEQQLKVAQEGWEQLKEIKPTPPNITYSKKKF
jgi:cyclase